MCCRSFTLIVLDGRVHVKPFNKAFKSEPNNHIYSEQKRKSAR